MILFDDAVEFITSSLDLDDVYNLVYDVIGNRCLKFKPVIKDDYERLNSNDSRFLFLQSNFLETSLCGRFSSIDTRLVWIYILVRDALTDDKKVYKFYVTVDLPVVYVKSKDENTLHCLLPVSARILEIEKDVVLGYICYSPTKREWGFLHPDYEYRRRY